MKKIECVLFDLDGVLVDACEWHYRALNNALYDILGIKISRQDHESKYNGLPTKIKLQMLNVEELHFKKIWDLKQKYTVDIIKSNLILLSDKIELHKYLKNNNIKICCVTNSIKDTAELMLSLSGQLQYIDLLVTNENIKNNKPDPECYNYAIKKIKCDPKYSICVEDSNTGILAAQSSLIKNLWKVKNSTEVNLINFKNYIKIL
jgi:beta-phosphoglucomutase